MLFETQSEQEVTCHAITAPAATNAEAVIKGEGAA
jgi:hypothetical protein